MDKQEMNAQPGATDIEAGENGLLRPWVKPAFEREPLKEALSGPGHPSGADIFGYGS